MLDDVGLIWGNGVRRLIELLFFWIGWLVYGLVRGWVRGGDNNDNGLLGVVVIGSFLLRD